LQRLTTAFLFLLIKRETRAEAENGHVEVESEEDEEEGSDYLYEGADSDPIQEFILVDADEGVVERPSFLFGADNGPRVVEFYAPWCPHVSDEATTYSCF